MVKVFFAGAEAFPTEISECNGNALINYYYIKNKKNILTFKKDNNLKKLFLDSGAFTAWTKGVNIPIEEYCDFVKKADCDFYSVLDVIGNDKATYENQLKMEEHGTHPIPCFHVGDDEKYLEYYINKGYNLISLGGMVGQPTKKLILWLDKIFRLYPNQNFHGFGLTRTKLIERYNWYSVDSSAWIQSAASKKIFSYKHGNFYIGSDKNISVLNLKNNQKLIKFLKQYNLYSENLYEEYKNILKANIYGYMELEQIQPQVTKQNTLF